MKEIKINVLGRIVDSADKVIIEQENECFVFYIISGDDKQLVGKYQSVDDLVEQFDYDVIWLDELCSQCGKTKTTEICENCSFQDSLIDNPNITPNPILSCDNFQETCEEIQNTFPEATEFFGVDNEDYKDFIERQ